MIGSVSELFDQNLILSNPNSIYVTLTHKHVGADVLENFRTLTPTNFQFKIITKILVDKFSLLTPKIVYENQRDFIRSRQIYKCVYTSEALNLLHKKYYGINMTLNIDISKVFDTLDWNFLLHVIH